VKATIIAEGGVDGNWSKSWRSWRSKEGA